MKEKFDAVRFQRKSREEMSREYTTDPEAFLRKLKEKYRHLRNEKVGSDAK